jgi:PTS system N-acetylgalactosamine-specific IIA component
MSSADAGAAPDARRAVVAGHGEFAAGLVSAVAQICGRESALVPLSNRGMGAEDLEATLRAELDVPGTAVIFTDLPAGSWTIAARRVVRDRPGVVLVTGVNLATLLDFVFHGELGTSEAAQHAVEKGRASIGIPGAPRGG